MSEPARAASSAAETRVLLVGLGAVGRAVGTELASKDSCVIVGAVDIDPRLAGLPLSTVVAGAPPTARISSIIRDAPPCDVAFVATTSFLHQLEPVVRSLVQRGVNVVSICEELGYPFTTNPRIADTIDVLAREHGVTVLGTGCNPGMLMDTLPLTLSSLTLNVKGVRMRRSADMSGYGAILTKFGLGLTEEAFARQRESGEVIGHVGFAESISALASGLGWRLDRIEVAHPESLFVTPEQRNVRLISLAPGTVAVIRHGVKGFIGDRAVIDAAIDFGIFAANDPYSYGGSWLLESDFQDVEFTSPPGLDSFLSTVAVAANVLAAVRDAPSGLLTMADMPSRQYAAR